MVHLHQKKLGYAVLLASLALAGLATISLARADHQTTPIWRPHIAQARSYANSRSGEVAFAAIDQGGHLSGFHISETAPAASVFKVMLLVAYLREGNQRPVSSSARALLGPMILRSDSVAATTVRDEVGVARIEHLARRAGMRDFQYNPIWGLSRTSPRDQVRFMYNLESYIPRSKRAYTLYLLSHITKSQRWGIGRVQPQSWALFFKGGWGSGSGRVDHQVALLKQNRQRIALAVFTQFDPDHNYGKQTLRGVAGRLLHNLK